MLYTCDRSTPDLHKEDELDHIDMVMTDCSCLTNMWIDNHSDHIWHVYFTLSYNLDDTPFANVIKASSIHHWKGIADSIKGIGFITQTGEQNKTHRICSWTLQLKTVPETCHSSLASRKGVAADTVMHSRELCLQMPWVTGDSGYHTNTQPLVRHDRLHIVAYWADRYILL